MADVFLERTFDDPLTDADLKAMVEDARGCFGIYRVNRPESLLAYDRQRMVCHFVGPDAEAVRGAMRQLPVDTRRLWSGTIHDAPGRTEADIASANVAVVRYFDDAVEMDDIQAIEDAGASCLEMRDVEFMRTWFATDRKSMVCLYRAPDAESVREAQREAKMPFDAVWPFHRLPGDPQ